MQEGIAKGKKVTYRIALHDGSIHEIKASEASSMTDEGVVGSYCFWADGVRVAMFPDNVVNHIYIKGHLKRISPARSK